MEERDYYWDTIFEQQRRWTDYELEKRDYVDDEYCSYLVIPQRRRKRLQEAVSRRRAVECELLDTFYPNGKELAKNDLALQTYHHVCMDLVNADKDEYRRCLKASTPAPAFALLAELLRTSRLAPERNDSRELIKPTEESLSDVETKAESERTTHSQKAMQENQHINATASQEIVQPVDSQPTPENDDGSSRITQITYKPFELSDVPTEELRRRLNKGEIAPRDEWLPTGDTTNKKSVVPAEAKERLGFAERLRSEAMSHFNSNRLEEAATYFIQGCHLLEYYKCPSDDVLNEKLQNELRRFRLNAARCCLKLRKFREAMVYVNEQLKEDPDDGVAMYLKGKSYEEAGDYDRAYQEYNALRQSPYATDAERHTGLVALHRLRKGYATNSSKLKTMLEIYNQTLPEFENGGDDSDADEEGLTFPDTCHSEASQLTVASPSSNSGVGRSAKPSVAVSVKPVIEKHQDMIDVLAALLKVYTSSSMTAELEAIRFKADFDESKVIRALRKYLPTILAPILVKYGYGSNQDDYMTLKRKFDQDVLYHRHNPEASEDERRQISSMMRDLHEVLVGAPLD